MADAGRPTPEVAAALLDSLEQGLWAMKGKNTTKVTTTIALPAREVYMANVMSSRCQR